MTILAADIGGTHARLAVFGGRGRRPDMLRERTWPSEEHDGLLPILQAFLADQPERPEAACLALAGPVRDGVCRMPNLGWEVHEAELSRETGIDLLFLLNDFRAIAHGVLVLRDDEVATLQPGVDTPGHVVAVVGAGTGLGVAAADRGLDPPRVLDSEGGHADFAPRTDQEWALARFLAARYGRASWERVLSGDGLMDVYEYLRGRDGSPEGEALRNPGPPAPAPDGGDDDDPSVRITRRALAGDDPVAERALEMFVSAYGAFAGNVALTLGARSGVYVAGGIAPHILDALRGGGFMEAFRSAGRMRDYLGEIPVRVVLNEDVGLLGAASAAMMNGPWNGACIG